MQIVLVTITSFAIYVWLTSLVPCVSPNVKKAIKSRGDSKISSLEVFVSLLAHKLLNYVKFDEIRMDRLQSSLDSLNMNMSADIYTAKSIIKGVLFALILSTWAIILPIFILPSCLLGYSIYSSSMKKIDKKIKERRLAIERELPQFAGTIRQCLSSTRSIVIIFESYQKICGPFLRSEIERTLNDIKMGSEERALKSLENRISSAKFSELVRGLISVLRGDDQRLYFEMLTHEYIRAENENVRKELLERPDKMNVYVGALLACMILLLASGVIPQAVKSGNIFI